MPIPRITREELKARLDAGDPPVILDVRLKYPYEHSTVIIPGAIRVPPGTTDFPTIPTGRDVVVYDSDPHELVSAPIAGELLGRGIKASALKGGMTEWMAANLPTELRPGAKPPAPAAPAAATKS